MVLMRCGLFLVDVKDQGFPAALDAARIEIHLDEAVDGVDGRRLVLDPRDVVRLAIGDLAGAIELDERVERLRDRRFGKGLRRFEVLDDFGDVRAVLAVDAIDLFDELAVRVRSSLMSRELRPYFSLKPFRSAIETPE